MSFPVLFVPSEVTSTSKFLMEGRTMSCMSDDTWCPGHRGNSLLRESIFA